MKQRIFLATAGFALAGLFVAGTAVMNGSSAPLTPHVQVTGGGPSPTPAAPGPTTSP